MSEKLEMFELCGTLGALADEAKIEKLHILTKEGYKMKLKNRLSNRLDGSGGFNPAAFENDFKRRGANIRRRRDEQEYGGCRDERGNWDKRGIERCYNDKLKDTERRSGRPPSDFKDGRSEEGKYYKRGDENRIDGRKLKVCVEIDEKTVRKALKRVWRVLKWLAIWAAVCYGGHGGESKPVIGKITQYYIINNF